MRDFTDQFNTELSPKEEIQFLQWAEKNNRVQDLYDYDLRGFWKEGYSFDATSGHATDRFKKPNHPTFSTESQYHESLKEDGSVYRGGVWSYTPNKIMQFMPSIEMLQDTHPLDKLQLYMKTAEPNIQLLLPEGYK